MLDTIACIYFSQIFRVLLTIVIARTILMINLIGQLKHMTQTQVLVLSHILVVRRLLSEMNTSFFTIHYQHQSL